MSLSLRGSTRDHYGDGYSEPDDDEEELDLRWEHNCQKVLKLLAQGKRRLDDSAGKSDTPILEKQGRYMLTRRMPHEAQSPTALHILAKRFKEHYSMMPKDTLVKLIGFLLDKVYSTGPLKGEEPVLMVALKYGGDDFIDCIMQGWPQKFPELLDEQNVDGQNSLHRVFAVPRKAEARAKMSQALRDLSLERGYKFVYKAKPETLAAQDKEGNTPIHYAMHYLQCHQRPKTYVEMFREMVIRGDGDMEKIKHEFNYDGESPIIYHQRTRGDAEEKQREKEQAAAQERAAAKQQKQAKSEKNISEDPVEAMIRARRDELSRENDLESIKPFEDDKKDPSKLPPTAKVSQENDVEDTEQIPASRGNGSDKAFAGKLQLEDVDESFLFEAEKSRLRRRRTSLAAASGSRRADETKPDGPPMNTTSHSAQSHTQRPTSTKKGEDKSIEDILEFLKLRYIRSRSDLKARELIYGKNKCDKNFYFDASDLDHKGSDKIAELVEKMSVGGFHDTLSYVNLPTVVHNPSADSKTTTSRPRKSYGQGPRGVDDKKGQDENPNLGRSSLVSVFDKLRQYKVKNVLRLHVEDMESPSHTDEAIQMSLRGTDWAREGPTSGQIYVEAWDWRKPDLSTDVIYSAAPTVETVNLYWSGNHMVLKGWGCADGIPKLYGYGYLKKVVLFASPGVETRKSMESRISGFKSDIKKSTGGKVEVEIRYEMSGLRPRLDSKEEASSSSGGGVVANQHKWVDIMDQFRVVLKNHIHPELDDMKIPTPERVKVALIDDGVNLSKLDFYGGTVQATGQSYCPRSSRSESPWYRSSTGHGTIMANMILRINPWISLQVLKLHASPSGDGGCTFFPETIATAIEDAVSRKVDVIVMSWTLKMLATGTGPGGKSNYEGRIKKAIEEAKENNILMFCSASDDITRSSKDSFPYGGGPSAIFRIGAALSEGRRDPNSEDVDHIDYFFPGNQVAERWNPRSGATPEVKYHDGASVGTALAAGLASLIIYCTILVRSYHQPRETSHENPQYKTYKDHVNALKEMDKMRKAFNNITADNWKKEKYLPVWGVFGQAKDGIVAARTAKVAMLQKLVDALCSNLAFK